MAIQKYLVTISTDKQKHQSTPSPSKPSTYTTHVHAYTSLLSALAILLNCSYFYETPVMWKLSRTPAQPSPEGRSKPWQHCALADRRFPNTHSTPAIVKVSDWPKFVLCASCCLSPRPITRDAVHPVKFQRFVYIARTGRGSVLVATLSGVFCPLASAVSVLVSKQLPIALCIRVPCSALTNKTTL